MHNKTNLLLYNHVNHTIMGTKILELLVINFNGELKRPISKENKVRKKYLKEKIVWSFD
jgi:hypothetical protein